MASLPACSRGRRLGLVLACCLFVQLSAPPPALAWFGWLDKWSGPGRFWGLLYDARLFCFGEQSGVSQVAAAYERAQRSTRLAVTLGRDLKVDQFTSILGEWLETLRLLEAVQQRWHSTQENQSLTQNLLNELNKLVPKADAHTKTIGPAGITSFLQQVEIHVPKALGEVSGQVISAAATGMFWSVCSDKRERRVSIEFSVGDWHGFDNDNNARFSGGTSIRLITVMPSVTWSVIPSKGADFLDIGIAGGYYAFTSEGFESVRGFIMEPVRIDIHAPTSWANYPRSHLKRFASMFTYRFGLMTIPGGFAADAFAPGSQDGPIAAEVVPVHAVYFNLNSLISNPNKKVLPKTVPEKPTP